MLTIDLIEVLDELGIEYKEHGQHTHSTYGWVNVCCPFCADSSFKRGIHLEYLTTNCWACGKQSLAETLAAITGQHKSVFYKLKVDRSTYEKKDKLKRGHLVLPKGLQDLTPLHKKYLINRGLDPNEMITLWGIKATTLHSKLPWKLWIPVEYRGEVISWTTRSLNDKGRRYINAKANEEVYPIKSVLFGADYARHAIIIVEGPFDVFKIGPGAVATLGVAYTDEQLAKMAKYPVRTICFDNEPAAQQRARKLLEDLSCLSGETVNVILDSKDAGSASKREIKELRKRVE